MKKMEDYVRSIPDFPEKGIIFRDVTSVLQDADGLNMAINEMQKKLEGLEFDAVVGLESRGFIFGMPIAYNLHKPFIPVRKKGKLPGEKISETYELEYGTDTIEMHTGCISHDDVVLIHDDLLATGGTMAAASRLIKQFGPKKIMLNAIIELTGCPKLDVFPRELDLQTILKIDEG